MKRVFISMLVILLAVLTKSNAATQVWSGEFKSEEWSKVLDVDASTFSTLKVGDQVVFEGDGNGAEIQIANKDWTSYITANSYNCVPFYGSYTVDVNESVLNNFQGGIHVKGKNLTLRSISIKSKEESGDADQEETSGGEREDGKGWNGNFDSNGWNSILKVGASAFSALGVGSEVIFKGSTTGSGQIQIANKDWTSYIPDNANKCDDFNGTYTIDIDETNIAFFQKGINVKGQNFTLESITVKTPADIAEENKDKAWYGKFKATTWKDVLDIEGSVFSSLKLGELVVFKGDAYGTSDEAAQIQIADNDYETFITENKYNCVPFNGTYTVYVDESNLSIFQGGIHVKGIHITLKSIEIKPDDTTSDPIKIDGSFHVDGTKLLDANGNEFIMRGCNYSYAWQKGQENSVIPAAKRIGCNTIRINISNGNKFTYCDRLEVRNLIRLCEENKLVCVLCVHDALGSDQISDLDNTVDYWKSIKNLVIGHEATVIVNIANEWVGQWEAGASVWEEGYVKAIKELREAGIKNTLMIDCAGYGQYPAVIGTNGRTVFAADPLKNSMFSIHMYQYDAGTAEDVRSNINQALAINVPLCIGEFAYSHQGSSVAYQTIMDYCKEKNVGYLVWSWTGNSGGAESCDMFGGYDENAVKENGQVTVWGTNGIKETSKECSIYSGIVSDVEKIHLDDNATIDFNEPYEIFNMNGQRVQGLTTSGVYILRQGGIAVKVRK